MPPGAGRPRTIALRDACWRVLLATVTGTALAAAAPHEVTSATARLLSLERTAACGVFHVGAIAVYELTADAVPASEALAAGVRIEVVIGCPELSRAAYAPDAGSLASFEVGALHAIELSAENTREIEVVAGPDGKLPRFFLWAARPAAATTAPESAPGASLRPEEG